MVNFEASYGKMTLAKKSVLDIDDEEIEHVFIEVLREKILQMNMSPKHRYYLICNGSKTKIFHGSSTYEVWLQFVIYKITGMHISDDEAISNFLEGADSWYMNVEDYFCNDLFRFKKYANNNTSVEDFIDYCVRRRFDNSGYEYLKLEQI